MRRSCGHLIHTQDQLRRWDRAGRYHQETSEMAASAWQTGTNHRRRSKEGGQKADRFGLLIMSLPLQTVLWKESVLHIFSALHYVWTKTYCCLFCDFWVCSAHWVIDVWVVAHSQVLLKVFFINSCLILVVWNDHTFYTWIRLLHDSASSLNPRFLINRIILMKTGIVPILKPEEKRMKR